MKGRGRDGGFCIVIIFPRYKTCTKTKKKDKIEDTVSRILNRFYK